MIHNINGIQNKEDLTNLSKYTDEYLIEALANLGQRLGIKGDGIKYSSFKFSDIIGNTEYNDSEKYIGSLYYIEDNDGKTKAIFNIIEKNKLLVDSQKYITQVYEDVYASHIIKDEMSFTVPVNNIEKYKEGSIILQKNDTFTSILNGKLIGTDDTDSNNIEVLYTKINDSTQELIEADRAFYLYSDNVGDYYTLIRIVKSSDSVSPYYMYVKLFNASLLPDSLTGNEDMAVTYDMFINSFCWEKLNESGILNMANNDYIDDPYGESVETSVSLFEVILNDSENKDAYPEIKIPIKFDSDNNLGIDYENLNVTLESKISNLKNYNLDIISRIKYITNDITYLYEYLLKYYNEVLYNKDISTFSKNVLCRLYENMYNSQDTDVSYNVMYIPLDYKITYMCNSNNALQIYYSTNITISKTDLKQFENDESLSLYFEQNKNITYSYLGEDKVIIFNFQVEYNTIYETLINNINVFSQYQLPFINSANNWEINGNDSNISALGKNAGNPNIIIAYNKIYEYDSNGYPIITTNKDNVKIINTVANKDKIDDNIWTNISTFLVPRNAIYTGTNIDDTDTTSYAILPYVTKLNIEYLQNSIIILLTDVSCIKSENLRNLITNINDNEYFASLWSIKYDSDHLGENGIYQFSPVNDPVNTKYALDFGKMLTGYNTYNQNSSSETVSNTFDQLLLRAKLKNLAQEENKTDGEDWFLMHAITKSQNDLNMHSGFYNSIKGLNSELPTAYMLKSDPYYINNIENSIKVTNNEYPVYEERNSTDSYTYTYSWIKEEISDTQRLLRVSYWNSYLSENELINSITVTGVHVPGTKISYIVMNEEKTAYYTYMGETGNYYPEYMPDENIPIYDDGDILKSNENIINRVNIISLDSYGSLYYSYLGTSYTDTDKDIIHIGTGNENINIGTYSLLNPKEKSKFKKHKGVSLDFDKIILNSKFTYANVIWNEQKTENETYYTTQYKPIGKLSTYTISGLYINGKPDSESNPDIENKPCYFGYTTNLSQKIENNALFRRVINSNKLGDITKIYSSALKDITSLNNEINSSNSDRPTISITFTETNNNEIITRTSLENIDPDTTNSGVTLAQMCSFNRHYGNINIVNESETKLGYYTADPVTGNPISSMASNHFIIHVGDTIHLQDLDNVTDNESNYLDNSDELKHSAFVRKRSSSEPTKYVDETSEIYNNLNNYKIDLLYLGNKNTVNMNDYKNSDGNRKVDIIGNNYGTVLIILHIDGLDKQSVINSIKYILVSVVMNENQIAESFLDTLYINGLFKNIFNIDINKFDNVNIDTGKNALIKYEDKDLSIREIYVAINYILRNSKLKKENDYLDIGSTFMMDDKINVTIWQDINNYETNLNIIFDYEKYNDTENLCNYSYLGYYTPDNSEKITISDKI